MKRRDPYVDQRPLRQRIAELEFVLNMELAAHVRVFLSLALTRLQAERAVFYPEPKVVFH